MAKRKPAEAVPERARGGPARTVAELVPAVGAAAFRRFGFIQASVVTRWAEIVGPRYAAVSTPESIRFPHGKRMDGVLTLVAPAAHAPMLQHVAPTIIERVNRFFGYGAVARVSVRHGTMPARPVRPVTAQAPVPAALGDSLRTVADPELKAVLEALAQGVANRTVQIPVVGKIS